MNIFYLDQDPKECAAAHYDVHLRKMTTEYLQILSTVCHIYDKPELAVYKKTHVNHPSVKWAAESKENYLWLLELLTECHSEWRRRFDKPHAAGEKICMLGIPDNLPEKPFTQVSYGFRKQGHEECYLYDHIAGYRKYYTVHKLHLKEYTNCHSEPEWMVNE